jgi:hypothetical protein
LIGAHYTLGFSSATAFHVHRRGFFAFVRQRYRNGVGTARIALKYRDRLALIEPLAGLPFLIIRELARGRINMIPYRTVHGIATFAGVVIGYSKLVDRMGTGNSDYLLDPLMIRRLSDARAIDDHL